MCRNRSRSTLGSFHRSRMDIGSNVLVWLLDAQAGLFLHTDGFVGTDVGRRRLLR